MILKAMRKRKKDLEKKVQRSRKSFLFLCHKIIIPCIAINKAHFSHEICFYDKLYMKK